jgi:hypothetical protein
MLFDSPRLRGLRNQVRLCHAQVPKFFHARYSDAELVKYLALMAILADAIGGSVFSFTRSADVATLHDVTYVSLNKMPVAKPAPRGVSCTPHLAILTNGHTSR